MRFAATGSRGISSLTGLFLLGWSVAATAQSVPPNQTKVGQEQASQNQAPANQAGQAKPTQAKPAKTKPLAVNPAQSKPANATEPTQPSQAGATAETAGGPATASGKGEPWAKAPAGQPSPAAASPTSPWPEGAAKPGDENAPPPVYYVEQQPNAAPNAPAPGGQAPTETPLPPNAVEPMQLHVDEPPPPPVPRHVAPRTALWLGARVGYFIPFGDLWGRCSSNGYSSCDRVDGTKFNDVAASGPMFELDAGVRLGRNYVIYLAWERAQLGAADGPSPDPSVATTQSRAESDFFALGVRLSADPDEIGLLLDLAIGARRMQGMYEGGSKLQLSDAPMESRLGIGVDFRTNRFFTLSPMITLGLGSFGKADWVQGNTIHTAIPSDSDRLTHGWVTLQLGGHFDLIGGG